MKAVIWTKPNCIFCAKAKNELDKINIEYEERVLGRGWDIKDLIAIVPKATTVPQIFIDNILIGGYNDLMSNKTQ